MKQTLLPLCLFLAWSLPRVLSRCQGQDNMSLTIHPEGVIKVPYGQPMEIFCHDDKFTADDLEFANNGNKVPSEKFNTTTRRLTMDHPVKGVFAYYCRNMITNKVCPSRVLVDTAPLDVTDFACKSKNLDTLNCSWTNPESYSVTNYSMSLSRDGNLSPVCIITNNKFYSNRKYRKRFCYLSTQLNPRYRQTEEQFIFLLKLCNFFGCNEQNFTIDHFTIVKPDPPSHLKVLATGTHSMLLQWSIPNNMFDFLPNGVDHKIEYEIAKTDNTSYFRKVNTSGLPPKNKTYKFLLTDLPYAHMQYEVRIYIRPKEAVKDEFWSDFTYQVFYTASERPNRPPDTVVGAFDQNPFETKRRIYVYWKQLEEYEEAGANFTYKVVAHQRTANSKTLQADNKNSLSYVVLEDASLGAINVEIWSTNDVGSSLSKSHLYIPPNNDTVALRVQSFTKLVYENGTYKLTWVGISKIDNYTVFWCQHNTTKICAGRMNFTILEANKTNHVIDLPRENRYQFAISTNNGTKTSGMVWTTCDISKDGIPVHGIPVKLDHGVPGKSFVKITWTMACTLQEGIITGYLITYCPVKDTSNVCDTSFDKSTVNISDPKQMAVNITDLKPYRTYQFSLALNTTYELKTMGNASTGVTTTEDTPTSPRNIQVTNVESNSVVISWDPPLEKNGIIGKYVIYNYTEPYAVDKVLNKDEDYVRRSYKLKGLDGFSNYSWSVAACNSAIRSCSQRSPANGIFVKTKIGTPSKIESQKIFGNDIKWKIPEKSGGPVDYYQIMKVGKYKNILNTTNLYYTFTECEEGVVEEMYRIRAINYDQGTFNDTGEKQDNSPLEYPGEWSNPIKVKCDEGFPFNFIITTVALVAFIIVSLYELLKFSKRKRYLCF